MEHEVAFSIGQSGLPITKQVGDVLRCLSENQDKGFPGDAADEQEVYSMGKIIRSCRFGLGVDGSDAEEPVKGHAWVVESLNR